MTVRIFTEVLELDETADEISRIARDLSGDPFERNMMDAAVLVSGAAKRNLVGYRSPRVGGVDTGRLRASIAPEVRRFGPEVVGVVGSNVKYAPHVELGTKPHWPPLASLETWARRHGTTAFVVSRAIARRGTFAKRYLQKAFDSNVRRIVKIISDGVESIVD